jgi:hypothetical protein
LGVGLLSGSFVVSALLLLASGATFSFVVRREEEALATTFGKPFDDYRESVPRFLPKFSGWRDAESVTVSPVLLYTTVRDSLVFACAVPLFEVLQWAHAAGWVPSFVQLP